MGFLRYFNEKTIHNAKSNVPKIRNQDDHICDQNNVTEKMRRRLFSSSTEQKS